MQKILIVAGLIILVIGLLYPYLQKLPFGKLPGDLFFSSDKVTFAFPIATCLIISIVITILYNLFK